MEKIKYTPPCRSKLERVGTETGLLDKDKNKLLVGDKICLNGPIPRVGRLLWNRNCNRFGLCFGLWYGNKDEYDIDSYGKFIEIPRDNGMRMELSRIN